MASPYIQLEGNIMIGPVGGPLVDYSNQITRLTITWGRNMVTIPATFADAQESQKAGSHTQSVSIDFFNDPTSASSFWAEVWDAVGTDDAELEFEATFVDAAVSPTNPQFSATFVVSSVDTGGTPGDLRSQSQTFPIVPGTLVKATS